MSGFFALFNSRLHYKFIPEISSMGLLANLPITSPPLWLLLPFCVLLLALAAGPLVASHFWEKAHPWIICLLGAVPVVYYLAVFRAGSAYLHVLEEYASFMIVIGSLFVVAGGVDLQVKGKSKPWTNVLFLLAGAILGNVIGTTGASMLLIRPWIQVNKSRFSPLHVVFFIFVVSNIGGALTPMGPPLFMGYIKGVPFWWGVIHCWLGWLVSLALTLTLFYLLDRRNFLAIPRSIPAKGADEEKWRAGGLHHLLFMGAILIAIIFVKAPYREGIMLASGLLSYFTASKEIHRRNHFSFAPIREVGWIFLGIFATMKPMLDAMELHAGELGLHSDAQFYWYSGVLSGFLDNAPTYLTFLAAAFGLNHLALDDPASMSVFLAQHGHYLVAISLGSTCFGALTYLGNGPNLMVKSICDHASLPTPHFFSYIFRYSLPLLIPIFVLVSWLFF